MWLGKYRNAENAFRTALQFKPFFKEAQDGLDQATREAYVTQQDPRAFEKEFPMTGITDFYAKIQ
jgi:cytochrome c-type biogenesis protein CcmH/NrfG